METKNRDEGWEMCISFAFNASMQIEREVEGELENVSFAFNASMQREREVEGELENVHQLQKGWKKHFSYKDQ